MSGLKLNTIAHKNLCHGWHWTIADEDILAYQIARLALGQYRHIARVLASDSPSPPKTSADQIKSAVKMLTLKKEEPPWHRDGWLFQAISWIAAHQAQPGSAIRPPQIRKADKGFDGLQLELSQDGSKITAAIIFEDKATDNARKTITDEVWPGIVDIEAGNRTAELVHETTALLEGQRAKNSAFDVDSAINGLLWKEVRRYRVSITVDDHHAKPSSREKLFDGFDQHAPGNSGKRQANTLQLHDLRPWMAARAAYNDLLRFIAAGSSSEDFEGVKDRVRAAQALMIFSNL